jgi:hypothetical protein
VVVHESSATPATPTTTTTTTTRPSTAGVVTAPTQPVTPLDGSLQQPDDASATYSFAGQGSVEVSVSWTPSTTLSLTVTCGSDTQVQEGSSSISMLLPDAEGPCDLVLKEMLVQYVAVSYTGMVGPGGG